MSPIVECHTQKPAKQGHSERINHLQELREKRRELIARLVNLTDTGCDKDISALKRKAPRTSWEGAIGMNLSLRDREG